MHEDSALTSDIDQLAAAIAARFAASVGTARTEPASTAAGASVSLVGRLASAVGQRLAARTGPNIDILASAVATRLAASAKAAPLTVAAASHFAGSAFSSPELERVASKTAYELRTRAEA